MQLERGSEEVLGVDSPAECICEFRCAGERSRVACALGAEAC